MKHLSQICTAHSCAAEPYIAAFAFHREIMRADTELVIFFCSNEYDLDVLGAEMKRLFAGVEIVGLHHGGRNRSGRLP